MKLVVPVRLYPDAAQEAALRVTLDLCNEAANFASSEAYRRRVFAKQTLQRLTYGRLKEMGLSAQPAIHVARKVAGAYVTLKANIRAGNLGEPGSQRRVAAQSKPIRFRRDAAQPFDDRCLSWQMPARTVSIWTVRGRLAGIRFSCSEAQYATLVAHRRGESDLVFRDGKWFLYATCDIGDVAVKQPDGFLGVDLGIANIATTSDGTRHCGKGLNRVRHRNQRLRAKLQAKGTKSAKRLLKKRRRKEARFAADANHTIAKRIVTEAERTGCGIALPGRLGWHPRPGTAPTAPAGHAAFLGVRPTRPIRRLQGGTGRGGGRARRPGVHLAGMLRLPPHRPEESTQPVHLPLPVVRLR